MSKARRCAEVLTATVPGTKLPDVVKGLRHTDATRGQHMSIDTSEPSVRKGPKLLSVARRRWFRLALLPGVAIGLGALFAPTAALAAPGGTGHTVTMTEITHGVFDPEI